jgi:hypothetical protein
MEGVLSLLLWSLVVDNFLWDSMKVSIILWNSLKNGKFPRMISEVLETVLKIVQQWYDKTSSSINPNKMVTIPFTRTRDIRGLKKPTL